MTYTPVKITKCPHCKGTGLVVKRTMRLLPLSIFAVLMTLLCAVAVTSCTDVERSRWYAYGDAHVIRLYAADGHVIQEWESTGKVACTEGGICDFMDAKTGKLVRTTGDIVVTVK